MKICANTLLYMEEPLTTSLKKLGGMGFSAIDIFADSPAIDYRQPQPDEITQIKSLGQKYGVEYSMHGPCWDINPASENAGHREDVVAHYLQGIRLAAAIGASTMVVHSGWKSDSKLSARDALRYSTETIARCATEAERLGVTLGVENVGYGAVNMFDGIEDWIGIAKSIASPAVGLTLDTGHAVLEGFDPAAAILAAGPRLKHVHLHSNMGKADDHLRLDRGIVDFGPVIRAMRQIGFAGHASIEIYAPDGEKEEALQASRKLLQELWEMAN
ncbi:MAG: sugar phosphate isomerase/epimerase family protein [Candidatus Korobacteraceae bacterium]|jgi:sugar phosphate isomerase/epimerase